MKSTSTRFAILAFLSVLIITSCNKTSSPPENHPDFISTGNKNYLEVKTDPGVRKIYFTEYSGLWSAIVFNEQNHPELMRLSVLDSTGNPYSISISVRKQLSTPSVGEKLLTKEYFGNHQDSRGKFLAFIENPKVKTEYYMMVDSAEGSFDDIRFTDGNSVIFKMSDMFCNTNACKLFGDCKTAEGLLCWDSLCELAKCIETGGDGYGPYSDCARRIAQVKRCQKMFETVN
jgi:hypothetical protein